MLDRDILGVDTQFGTVSLPLLLKTWLKKVEKKTLEGAYAESLRASSLPGGLRIGSSSAAVVARNEARTLPRTSGGKVPFLPTIPWFVDDDGLPHPETKPLCLIRHNQIHCRIEQIRIFSWIPKDALAQLWCSACACIVR